MTKELSDSLIRDSFIKIGLDTCYLEYFTKQVVKVYNEMQADCPDCEDLEEESNVDVSLRYATEAVTEYAQQLMKGHSEEWANAYAENIIFQESEHVIIHAAYDAIKNKEKADNELIIYLKELSNDPIFWNRYRYLFEDYESDAKEKTEEYCKTYYACLKYGKSDTFAMAFADCQYEEPFRSVYALAYEAAIEHGMSHFEAYAFGEKCTEGEDIGYFSMMDSYANEYNEDWQIDFYLKLIEGYDGKIPKEDFNIIREEMLKKRKS